MRSASIGEVASSGFVIIPDVMSAAECEGLKCHLGAASGAGTRGLLRDAVIREVAQRVLGPLIEPFFDRQPLPVRGIYFDKRPDVNWLVPWHQDLTIALKQCQDVDGFGPWSVKDGDPHVQPPVERLEQMLTARLHLDDADESNGALRVIAGSHLFGRLSAQEIQRMSRSEPSVVCRAKAGDVLLMRPLLLHASSRSSSDGHRRIVHVEYVGYELPAPLEWNEALSLH